MIPVSAIYIGLLMLWEDIYGIDHTAASTSSYSRYTDNGLLDGENHNLGTESQGRRNSTTE